MGGTLKLRLRCWRRKNSAMKPYSWTNRRFSLRWRGFRRIDPRRIRFRAETLMVIATFLAALAAGGSFWAALRQEDATYQSQLYDKQVGLIGTIQPDLDRFDREVADAFYGTATQEVLNHLKLQAHKVREKLQTILGSLQIILPSSANDLLFEITDGDLYWLDGSAGKAADEMPEHCEITHFAYAKNLSGPIGETQIYLDALLRNLGEWSKCISTLRSGRPLTEAHPCGTPWQVDLTPILNSHLPLLGNNAFACQSVQPGHSAGPEFRNQEGMQPRN